MTVITLVFLSACVTQTVGDTAQTVEVEDYSCEASLFYIDADLDGYGDPMAETVMACTKPSGYVRNAEDCDDTHDAVHPGAEEFCDGVDNDCDGITDPNNAVDAPTWYEDQDADDYGNPSVSITDCNGAYGYVPVSGDCDDQDASVFGGEVEICDGVDNDCDGVADNIASIDGTGGSIYYADADGDFEGDANSTIAACDKPIGYVDNPFDCNDADATIKTSADEVCDGVDNDCSGTVDDDPIDGVLYYEDADADGYGNPGEEQHFCDVPTGYVVDASDCDDNDAAISPSGIEECDWIDNDCNGIADDVADENLTTWYNDNDWDGFGDPAVSEATCSPSFVSATTDDTDCDDFDAMVNPMAAEIVGNSVDDDCDGTVL